MRPHRLPALLGLLLSLVILLHLPALGQKQAKRPAVLSPPPGSKLAPGKLGKKARAPKLSANVKTMKASKTRKALNVVPASTSCPTKTPISPGQTINGALASTDCPLGDGSFYDEYTFSATAGQQVAVSMSSTAFDTFLFLLKPSETFPGQATIFDDDGGGGTNSRIPASSGFLTVPETGTYSILANSFNAGETGPYSLTLTFGGQGTICPPNPTPITAGQTLNGTLDANDCRLPDNTAYDAYSFMATAGQQVTITMNAAAPLDAYLILLAPDGTDIAEDDNGGGGTNARIPQSTGVATLPQTGTYVIYASSSGVGQFGTYSISLSVSPTNCPSTPIQIGQTVNGVLDANDCRLPVDGSFLDSYTFSGSAGQRIAITMSSPAFNSYLFLLSPAGADIAEDGPTTNPVPAPPTSARIPGPTGFFTLPTTGTYTIYANSALPNQTGSYTLSLLAPPQVGQVVISELRFESPGMGAPLNDDFVEVQNVSASIVDLSGWKLRIDTGAGITDMVIANGTILQPRQHFLAVNAAAGGYSLGGYAVGDQTYAANLERGVALTLADNTVLDQVGRNVGTPIFVEVAPLPATDGTLTQNSFVRRSDNGLPRDTGNNETDFALVAVDPAAMSGSTLGAPGPENRSSPVQRNATIKATLIDNCSGTGTATPVGGCQSRVRLLAPDPSNPTLSPNGQLLIRRRFTNHTGGAVTRLRFRVVDITTAPAPGGQADLRALSSQDITVVRSDGGGTVDVKGLTLEQPPAQPNGGGLNSGLVTMAVPLADGAAIAVEFRLGVVQGGSFRFFVNVEALP